MLTAAENERLTRIGPGTPMGALQRRYWHPIAGVDEMQGRWTKRVRLLGEDLVLFKDRAGRLGLIHEFCPHRRASLAYGIPEADGIRCPYHGWKFDHDGACLEQPNEPPESTFKDKVKTPAYQVAELGGFIWAYLGPQPAPLIPRWEGLVSESGIRSIGRTVVPCNWLQIMENSFDPIHTEWLHGRLQEFQEEERGSTYAISRKHLDIAFEEFEYGVYKRRLLAGASPDSDDWKIGHPVIFPNTLAVGSGGGRLWKMHVYQMRVPMDDENTMHYWYTAYEPPQGIEVPRHLLERVPVYDVPFQDENGEFILDVIDSQDVMAWVTQGRIFQRQTEALGTSDRGIILFRKILQRELAKVEAGEDPMGVIRDPAKNVCIAFPLERDKVHFTDGFANLLRRQYARYSPIADELVQLFNAYNEKEIRDVATR
jgi:5,5'-dehydrodivanillate O-demethylase